MRSHPVVRALAVLTVIAGASSLVRSQGATITVNPNITLQSMRGWEVVAFADQLNPTFPLYQDAALDAAVAAGIDRIRLEVRSGSENPADSFANWQAAGYPTSGPAYTQWRATRYETVNDNADPFSIDPTRFHWGDVDLTIDNIVNPLRRRLALQGESLYVHFDYVAFLSQVTSGAPYVHQDPNEYAEFMVAAFQHLQSKYGWVPDGLEIILEPDNTSPPWSGTLIGQVVAATAPRLAAAGFRPDIIAPSTTCMSSAISWFDAMAAVPNALPWVTELSYHRYCGVSTASLQTIASRAASHGVVSSMLEWWNAGNTFLTLHEDLKVGGNGAWELGTIAERNGADSVAVAFVNDSNQVFPTYRTRYVRQYFQHIRRGAIRIGATSQTGQFDPLAFVNHDGRYTVVVKATAGGTLTIGGLPAGTYGASYVASTTGSPDIPNTEGTLPDQTIAAGQNLTVSMPAYGVLAVYGRASGPSPRPDPPTNLRLLTTAGGTVQFAWTPPAGGAPVTAFRLEGGFAPGNTAGAVPLGLTPGAALSLPPGTFYVRVRSAAGAVLSAPSNEIVVHNGAVLAPTAPANLKGLVVGSRLQLAWQTTWAGGTPDAVRLDVSGPISASVPLGVTDGFTVPAAPAGTYTFRVRESNALGTSPASNAVTVSVPTACSGTPQPVANVQAYALAGRLFLSWDPGAGGPAPTAFVVSAGGTYSGAVTVAGTSMNVPVPHGAYTLQVAAANACGTSTPSAGRTVIVP
ncbi:MAG: hypothetical protein AB7O28_10955 [Vicinamibacterales bacterium]